MGGVTSKSLAVGTVAGTATYFGLKAILAAGILGLCLPATLIAGAVVVGIAATAGVYYYLKDDGEHRQQVKSNTPLSAETLSSKGHNVPKWSRIDMTRSEFNMIVTITQQKFVAQINKCVCPFSMEVMRQPSQMKCCKNKLEKSQRRAERVFLLNQIERRGRCLLCQSQADASFIEEDDDIVTIVTGLRFRVHKTYMTANDQEKKKWKRIIDRYFGENYTTEYITQTVASLK